jgi:hypothetical protein
MTLLLQTFGSLGGAQAGEHGFLYYLGLVIGTSTYVVLFWGWLAWLGVKIAARRRPGWLTTERMLPGSMPHPTRPGRQSVRDEQIAQLEELWELPAYRGRH